MAAVYLCGLRVLLEPLSWVSWDGALCQLSHFGK